jgi:hypothetical protein
VEEDGEGVDLDGAGEGVDATVPATAIQPRGLRLVVGLRQGSTSMMRTPVRVRMSSGRRARTFDDI